MLKLFRTYTNPWLEQDRQHERRTIITVVVITLVVAGGFGFLIYALLQN